MGKFYRCVIKKISKSIINQYYDNYDNEIGKLSRKMRIKLFLEKCGNFALKRVNPKLSFYIYTQSFFWENIEKFEAIYELLSDETSKEKLIELLCYKLLGHQKVKLSLNNDDFWKKKEATKKYLENEKIEIDFRDGYLSLYNMQDLGFDLKLYYVSNGIVTDFILEQYNYKDLVKVDKKDIVIDAGGCWGDTALYFASKGAGRVFTFEFVPSNIEIMKRNISLNPQYQETIELIPYAIWSDSDVNLSFVDRGPSSLVGELGQYPSQTKTLSIDDLVLRRDLEKIDFIKMDIEGAEAKALAGAKETIKRDKPKLAISAYHRPDDLITLPKIIRSIRQDYTFFLNYYTIIANEIILYAV